MMHSGCVKLHQKFRDFVGLPMGLLREGSLRTRMNTGLFGSRSGEYGLKAARRAPQFCKRNSTEYRKRATNPENPVFSGLSLYSAKEKNAAASGEKAYKMQMNELKKPWKNAEGTVEE